MAAYSLYCNNYTGNFQDKQDFSPPSGDFCGSRREDAPAFGFPKSEKHFKLCSQLTELKRKGREGTAVPAAGGYNYPKLEKQFKLLRQLAERK